MKQRFGALLCLLLGGVLITSGLTSGAGGAVGQVVVPSQCGEASVGITVTCPIGVISISEQNVQAAQAFRAHRAAPAATPPVSWSVTITSTCLDPSTGTPVSQTVMVANGASQTSGPLYVYSDATGQTKCSYALAETPVAGYTASLAPASPVTIPDAGGRLNSTLAVTLTNTSAAPTTSAPTTSAPASSAPASSAPASSVAAGTSAPVSVSASATDTGVSSEPDTSAVAASTEPIANTGPRQDVSSSLWIGIALCLLGVALLFAGRVRRLGRHRG